MEAVFKYLWVNLWVSVVGLRVYGRKRGERLEVLGMVLILACNLACNLACMILMLSLFLGMYPMIKKIESV